MAEPYIYRIIKSSWGIWIRINCDIQPHASSEESALIKVNDNFYLSVALNIQILNAEMPYFIKGIELVADELKEHLQSPAVIRVTECTFTDTDYQAEGLTYAVAAWLAREYGLNWQPEEVIYDKEINRYIFPFTL